MLAREQTIFQWLLPASYTPQSGKIKLSEREYYILTEMLRLPWTGVCAFWGIWLSIQASMVLYRVPWSDSYTVCIYDKE